MDEPTGGVRYTVREAVTTYLDTDGNPIPPPDAAGPIVPATPPAPEGEEGD